MSAFPRFAPERGLDHKIEKRERIGSGLRPLGGGSAAAATMVLAAVIDCAKRLSDDSAETTRLRKIQTGVPSHDGNASRAAPPAWTRMTRHGLAHALHGFRLGTTWHRQRPEGRGEHDQQQKSCSPARSSPHLRDSIAVPSTQLPVLSCRERLAGYWVRQLLYHFSVHELAERLLKTIRKQESIRAGDRLAVAVSGGADSVALLCLLLELRAELGIVLSVAHVNHKLRGEESDEDERFVAELARQHGLELHVCAGAG